MFTKRPMFPHTFDSTMMASFRSCPQKMFRTYVEHWKPKSESVHLIAGGAFAKGVEVARKAFFDGVAPVWESRRHETEDGFLDRMEIVGSMEVAAGDGPDAEAHGLRALLNTYGDYECPSDSAKSAERMAGALEYYLSQYPLGADGAIPVKLPNGANAIEFSFAEPLGVSHPVTGDPILYTGRADAIVDFAGGVYGVDEKTTKSLGISWAGKWDMRSQFVGYQWAANRIGIPMQGTLVRGISILKTKYDTMQVLTYRSKYEVERWQAQTERDILRAINMWKEGYWDYSLDGACDEYGGCNLIQICKSSTPEDWLPMRFERKVWDPLARKQLSVEEWEKSWGHEPERGDLRRT